MSSRQQGVILLLLLLASWSWAAPRHLYLTWEDQDTAHTQTVVFQTLGKASNPRVEFQRADQVQSYPATTVELAGREIHHVTLRQLKPATLYRFRAGDDQFGLSEWRTFRTLPADDRPLTVVNGGDMYRDRETIQLLQEAAKLSPDVALVGGDLAYANGELHNMTLWDDWFDNWERHLNPKDGPMVGMICAIGNHEVQGHFGQTHAQAPMFFAFLPQGGQPTFTRRLGSEIELIVLDSAHVTSHAAQVPFLEQALTTARNRGVKYTVAMYHVPLYPSHRDPAGPTHALGRQFWLPVFDRHRLTVALEHHEHVFKRSHPLRANKIDPAGTVYLGDGCWGRNPRVIPQRRWFHVKALRKEHVWILKNEKEGLDCRAVDRLGQVFDQVTLEANQR